MNDTKSKAITIKRGVRQGFILSSLLFNVYSERIFRAALAEKQAGIIVNGEVINNLRYADDTVFIASRQKDLHEALNNVVEKCVRAGLDLGIKKTEISKQTKVTANSITKLDQVSRIRCLGS